MTERSPGHGVPPSSERGRNSGARPATRRGARGPAAAAAFALWIGTHPARATATPTPEDESEMALTRKRSPKAADLLEKGEVLAATGLLEQAHDLFQRGEAEDRDSSLLWRRDCEALTALGRRQEAVAACSMALESSRSNANFRALIRSLVGGPRPPTVLDLSVAFTLTRAERWRAPGQPTPVAAECDIAETLGDGVMLQQCADELRKIAPDDDPDTKRALATLDRRCPPWRFWSGWGAIASASGITAWHAIVRSKRRRRRRSAGAAAVAVALAWASVSPYESVARAEDSIATAPVPSASSRQGWLSTWPVDDDSPENSIPSEKDRNADPLQFGYWIQDVALKAEHASKRGDHAAAARFYAALAKAVPDRAISFIKMCDEYEAMGDRDRAANSCGDALLRDGLTVKDYVHFVTLVLDKPGPLDDKERAALAAVLQHMKGESAGREAEADLQCRVGVRTSNLAQLRECTTELMATAPDDPKTLSYGWALAIQEGHFDEATALIERAKSRGIQAEGIERMQRATAVSTNRHRLRIVLSLLAAVLLLAAGAIGVRTRASRRRPRLPA
jgi:tetratricopeptide (TPR) repeat protein